MKLKQPKTLAITIFLSIFFALAVLTPLVGDIESQLDIWRVGNPVYANAGSSTSNVFIPVIIVEIPDASDVELTDIGTRDLEDNLQALFYLGDQIKYVTNGVNNLSQPASVDLSWSQSGPCGTTGIFSTSLSLPPGNWQHTFSQVTPECSGTYLGTAQLDYFGYTSTLTTTFEIHLPSQVVTSTQQGFDSCTFPTVNQMQTWWDESPYVVRNIYLGGINYSCPTPDLTQDWVQSVAQQGWQFILTWVGPQPPCSNPDKYALFSSNPFTAYNQGYGEAEAAITKADSLALSAEKIIYYDLEIYPAITQSCNNAVNAFVQGWTDRLHQNGDKAGVYAAPCYSNSNMTDWWNLNSPRPDDVWIAHWLLPQDYNPDATVWTSCLTDTYWPDYQRLRQYAGDHKETWGGVLIDIDSDVMRGEITAVTGTVTTTAIGGEQLAKIREVELISPQVGWVLQGDQILLTRDGGERWDDITPVGIVGSVHDVAFLDASKGWVAVLPTNYPFDGEIHLYQTLNGGQTWTLHPLTFSPSSSLVGKIYLDFVDLDTVFVVLKTQSGSSFSHGRLFATQDGGLTWDERSAPLGEPVVFVDSLHGWIAGGPSEDQVFRTQDGGLTWRPQRLPGLPETGVFIGKPVFETSSRGYLPVTIRGEPYSQMVLYATDDGAETWTKTQVVDLPSGYEPGSALPFSLSQDQWWTGTPASPDLYTSTETERNPTLLTPNKLPSGLTELDFTTEGVGWALVQEGTCFGDKIPTDSNGTGSAPFYCLSQMRLFKTINGGVQWYEVLID